MMDAVAWNHAIDHLGQIDSTCYRLASTGQDRVLEEGKTHLPKVVAYSCFAVDHVATGLAEGVALPLLCSVGAAKRALEAPGAQRALVVLVPEIALAGGVVWSTAGAIVQGGCAAGCLLGATYHLTAAGYNGASRVVVKAANITAQAAMAAAHAIAGATEAAWVAILQGIHSL